jgi:tetratricopeptide (TPR) repeat protein
MINLTPFHRAVAAAACAIALSACKTAPVAPPTPQLQAMLAQATEAVAVGQKEKAVGIWKQASTFYPTDKAPWTNIAQTRFEAGQYGEAIVSAQEILVRDPNDKLANSIIATSGLRLATRSLGELSRQNGLVGPLRTESQELAKLLRETLGESNLFSDTAVAKAPVAAPKPVARQPRQKADTAKKDNSDPFVGLK